MNFKSLATGISFGLAVASAGFFVGLPVQAAILVFATIGHGSAFVFSALEPEEEAAPRLPMQSNIPVIHGIIDQPSKPKADVNVLPSHAALTFNNNGQIIQISSAQG